MKVSNFIICIYLFSCLEIFSQRPYPLDVGNTWIYTDEINYYKHTIIRDSVLIDSTLYFELLIQSDTFLEGYSRYVRQTNDFYRLRLVGGAFEGNEELYYRTGTFVGDIWFQPYDSVSYTEVQDSMLTNVFGQLMYRRLLEVNSFNLLIRNYEQWTEEIGMLVRTDFFGFVLDDLLGCVINGIVYGDTSFFPTHVDLNNEIPSDYNLSQNYPNPFNLNTSIKFYLPERTNVNLSIYNNLGQKIQDLINEEKNKGEHTIRFNAINLPSGIYIYLMKTNSFYSTKKMILLK
jgi:hypothetical protein